MLYGIWKVSSFKFVFYYMYKSFVFVFLPKLLLIIIIIICMLSKIQRIIYFWVVNSMQLYLYYCINIRIKDNHNRNHIKFNGKEQLKYLLGNIWVLNIISIVSLLFNWIIIVSESPFCLCFLFSTLKNITIQISSCY